MRTFLILVLVVIIFMELAASIKDLQTRNTGWVTFNGNPAYLIVSPGDKNLIFADTKENVVYKVPVLKTRVVYNKEDVYLFGYRNDVKYYLIKYIIGGEEADHWLLEIKAKMVQQRKL